MGLVRPLFGFHCVAELVIADGSLFRVRIPLGSDHLPSDALEMGIGTIPNQTAYGQGIVDEAMQWNRDREGSSVDSSSDSGVGSGETASSRGMDPSTLYFKKEDVIMLVDGMCCSAVIVKGWLTAQTHSILDGAVSR